MRQFHPALFFPVFVSTYGSRRGCESEVVDVSATKDLFKWMKACAARNQIIPLYEIISSPVRYVLSMKCVRILGIRLLDHEIPRDARQLQLEMLTCDQVGRLITAGPEVLLPELRHVITDNISRLFCSGDLPENQIHFLLGRLNSGFDNEISVMLRDLRERDWRPRAGSAQRLWMEKDIDGRKIRLDRGMTQRHDAAYENQYVNTSYIIPPSHLASGSICPIHHARSENIPLPPPPLPPPRPPPSITYTNDLNNRSGLCEKRSPSSRTRCRSIDHVPLNSHHQASSNSQGCSDHYTGMVRDHQPPSRYIPIAKNLSNCIKTEHNQRDRHVHFESDLSHESNHYGSRNRGHDRH